MSRVKKLLKEPLLFIILLIVLSIPLILPLLHKGFFMTDDGDVMIIRLTAFHEAIMHGQIPARFLPRLYFQYGYPVSNFLYPLYLYIGEVLHLIRFGFINSVKIILILSLLLSSVFTFLWLKKFFKSFSSLIGSLVYLYNPYHYYDVYKRGSVGEVLSLAIIPFILWAIELQSVSLSVLGVAFLILAHNTLAVLFLPVVVVYYAVRFNVIKNRKELLKLGAILCISLLMSAFFWIPALTELRYTIFSQTNVSDMGSYFSGVEPKLFTNLSIYYIVVLALCAFFFYVKRKNSEKNTLSLVMFFGVITGISLFLNTPSSLIIWKLLPITFIQFPFRLFSLILIFLSLFAAAFTDTIKNKSNYFIGIVFFLLFSAPLFFFLRPVAYSLRDDMYYATNEDSTTIKNEYLPIWVKERSFSKPKTIVEGKGVSFVSSKDGIYLFHLTGNEPRIIRVNMLYYPGWVASENGKQLSITYANKKGVMDIRVPKNTSEVTVKFTETSLRLLSDIVSIIGCIIFLGLVINDVKKGYNYGKK